MGDLKIIGKREIRLLLKWRNKRRRKIDSKITKNWESVEARKKFKISSKKILLKKELSFKVNKLKYELIKNCKKKLLEENKKNKNIINYIETISSNKLRNAFSLKEKLNEKKNIYMIEDKKKNNENRYQLEKIYINYHKCSLK